MRKNRTSGCQRRVADRPPQFTTHEHPPGIPGLNRFADLANLTNQALSSGDCGPASLAHNEIPEPKHDRAESNRCSPDRRAVHNKVGLRRIDQKQGAEYECDYPANPQNGVTGDEQFGDKQPHPQQDQ